MKKLFLSVVIMKEERKKLYKVWRQRGQKIILLNQIKLKKEITILIVE